ncbi:uncharacterized protein LOC132042110 [Lycium ferocissimum]|uniref:uncharacterized protein LOC132042110 n=1 Tax=Lycium ferocissimum TaxID=112874 RepID=UPI002816051C|nr:uncharacterized protein LOC132042110 [Lycium ferocissimum]
MAENYGDKQETLLFSSSATEENKGNGWFIDSGCSNHMSGNKELFVDLDESFKATKEDLAIMQRCLLLEGEKFQLLRKMDLLILYLSDDKIGLIARIKMNNSRLWPLYLNCGDLPCFSSVNCDAWLWHLRFGHLNFGSLNFLARKNLVDGLPSIDFPDRRCESCILGKKYREPFQKGKAWRANAPLESFKAYVEKQSGYFIKTLRSDRGTEFLVCDNYLKKYGIKHQLIARYNPQQNGVAKRKNRTVMDMVSYSI